MPASESVSSFKLAVVEAQQTKVMSGPRPTDTLDKTVAFLAKRDGIDKVNAQQTAACCFCIAVLPAVTALLCI